MSEHEDEPRITVRLKGYHIEPLEESIPPAPASLEAVLSQSINHSLTIRCDDLSEDALTDVTTSVRTYAQEPRMHVVVVASQKGGAGKTTISRSLAVAAQQTVGMTAILDMDPQGSLTSWWNRRANEMPALVKIDLADIDAGIAKLAAAGIELLIIDTPPSVHPELKDILERATLAVIPVRPSPDDLDAVGDSLKLIEEANVPFLFVLNQAKPRTRLQTQAVLALAKHGRVAPAVIHAREDFPTAAITGKTVTEVEQEGPSANEVRQVLTYVLDQLNKSASAHAEKKVANG